MDAKTFFLQPSCASQRQYEALRSFYVDSLSAKRAAEKSGFSSAYFKKLRFEFNRMLKNNENHFFPKKIPGPKSRFTNDTTINKIVAFRKRNHSIQDIKVFLDAEGICLSLDTIYNILTAEGFAPLPKRTRKERLIADLPTKFKAPRSISHEVIDEEFSTEKGVGPLIFLPLIEKLGIVPAIKAAGFPQTSDLNDLQFLLSFLAIKILGNKRLSYDTTWNLDRSLGFFAGLNVLPKSTTLSTYSYRITRATNYKFLLALNKIFKKVDLEEGEFNLDFKTIPHWGNSSVLEKNWSGSRGKVIKSLLALIVQDPSTGYLSYANAEIKHDNQNEAVFEFVDFWKQGRGEPPKMLIFDSKFTTYKNLSQLNQSKDNIKFLTLRRRGKNLTKKAEELSDKKWERIRVEKGKGKFRFVRVHDSYCKLRNYKGKVRQIILTDHGRKRPAFLVTNDFELDVRDVVKKYARRWLVEQEIAEQIAFFHLNQTSSSIVVKVDFDLTISLLVHNLYRVLAQNLPGFEKCTVPTIYRKFLENGALVKIKGKNISVHLKKKTHLPVLSELNWLKESTHLSWMDMNIKFFSGTSS